MARYSAGAITSAGTTLRPALALAAAAAVGQKIREVGVSNTTSTAVQLRVQRFTGGPGTATGLTEAKYDPDSVAASGVANHSHTVDLTAVDDLGYRAQLGAAVGAGTIFTFGDSGLRIPVGTTNVIGIVPEGTGQALSAYEVWDE